MYNIFIELLKVNDLYEYVGHNTGIHYFTLKKLEKLDNCSTAFLIDCGNDLASGRSPSLTTTNIKVRQIFETHHQVHHEV